ncbi:hypothetical protein ncot_13380 [Nocardioides sp. JQ2195]|uniref:DUF2231 domain-containing protein n=1 Tax=Nocardioides sp. JQ2195 TaxID=2592334 RepID=UPI00143E8A3D|nr:DUF2231 domain-containing protein [Nocardioides sp. JQ2195]QIX27490.1 hypothetical protein ncot_13380 [Nocardioides sp. JQ2195]
MEINGLPAHPLIIHVAVVLIPIAAGLSAFYAVVPRWRWYTRWPMVGFSAGALAAVMFAYFSGKDFLESRPELEPIIQPHQERAQILFWLTIVFMGVVLISAFALGGPSAMASGRGARGRHAPLIEWTLMVMLVIFAVALILMTFQTGDAGARLVWG